MVSKMKKLAAIALLSMLACNAGAQTGAPQEAPAATQEATVAADPAVWGPYAKLVGKTFAGEDVAGWPNYASKSRSIQWEKPGEVMLETGVYASGGDIPKMRIYPGKKPGDLVFDVEKAPNSTGRVVDADTLEFDLVFGYSSRVRVVDADSYEMTTLKRGEVKGQAMYRDTNSGAHKARAAELAVKAEADKKAAKAALRAAGVPDKPATDVPADRLLAYQEPVRGPSGTLRVTRGKAWEAGACFVAVHINGRWAARLEDAETALFKVPAGNVVVGVASDPQGRGTCRIGQATQETHETTIAKGESVHVYFEFNGGARFSEALMAPAAAATPAKAP